METRSSEAPRTPCSAQEYGTQQIWHRRFAIRVTQVSLWQIKIRIIRTRITLFVGISKCRTDDDRADCKTWTTSRQAMGSGESVRLLPGTPPFLPMASIPTLALVFECPLTGSVITSTNRQVVVLKLAIVACSSVITCFGPNFFLNTQ